MRKGTFILIAGDNFNQLIAVPPESPPTDPKTCPKCGNSFTGVSVFCSKCGTGLTADRISTIKDVRLTIKQRAFPSQGLVRFNVAHLTDLGIHEGDHVDLINETTKKTLTVTIIADTMVRVGHVRVTEADIKTIGLNEDDEVLVRKTRFADVSVQQNNTKSAASENMIIGFLWDTLKPSPRLHQIDSTGKKIAKKGVVFWDNWAVTGNMKTVVVTESNSIIYGTNNRGDGLDLSGASGDVMVEIPRFYTRSTFANGKFSYWISPVPAPGFTVAPMFNQRGYGTDAGAPAPCYYVGRYDASLIGNKLQSATGKAPAVIMTIGQARTYAENKGAGWGITNIWTLSGLRQLFYTEMLTLNSQAAFPKSKGITDLRDVGPRHSGADGADTNINTNGTGSGTGTAGVTPVVWRGIENLWGNVFQFQDGFNAIRGTAKVISPIGLGTRGRPTVFKDVLDANDVQSVGALVLTNGWQMNLMNTDLSRPLFLPSAVGGSERTFLSDFYWPPNSTTDSDPKVLHSGGCWHSGRYAGVGYLLANDGALHSDARIGARVEFRCSTAPRAPEESNFSGMIEKPELTLTLDHTQLIEADCLNSNAHSEFIGFSDVAGMHCLKKSLVRDVIEPLRNPEKYRKFKVSIPNGILLYGPPGCGKTYIVKKLAEELGYHFIEVSPSSIGSTYIHGTSLNIAKIFADAKNNKPAILFFDEFEGLVPKRESLGHGGQFKNEEINEFLTHLNNAGENQILVVCATNQIDLIDPAILRSGRIDKLILVPPPDFESRKELFKIKLIGRPHSKKIKFDKLSEKTEDYSSSDISLIVDNAARIAVEKNFDEIDENLLEQMIASTPSSIDKTQIEKYRNQSSFERK